MPAPDDIPEPVDLNWIARHLVAVRDELRLDLRALREDVRTLREDNTATCATASKP